MQGALPAAAASASASATHSRFLGCAPGSRSLWSGPGAGQLRFIRGPRSSQPRPLTLAPGPPCPGAAAATGSGAAGDPAPAAIPASDLAASRRRSGAPRAGAAATSRSRPLRRRLTGPGPRGIFISWPLRATSSTPVSHGRSSRAAKGSLGSCRNCCLIPPTPFPYFHSLLEYFSSSVLFSCVPSFYTFSFAASLYTDLQLTQTLCHLHQLCAQGARRNELHGLGRLPSPISASLRV